MKHTTKEALIDRAVGELLDLEMCVKKAHANDFGLFVRLYPIYREMSEILRGLELLPITDEDLWAFGYEYPLYELYKFTSFGQY